VMIMYDDCDDYCDDDDDDDDNDTTTIKEVWLLVRKTKTIKCLFLVNLLYLYINCLTQKHVKYFGG
jgi:hypothetical protein